MVRPSMHITGLHTSHHLSNKLAISVYVLHVDLQTPINAVPLNAVARLSWKHNGPSTPRLISVNISDGEFGTK